MITFARDAGVKRSELVSRALELLVDGATEIGSAKVAVRKPAPGIGTVAKKGKVKVRT